MKYAFRLAALQRRGSMPEAEHSRKSALISRRLFSTKEFRNAELLLTYVGFGREVSTLGIIAEAIRSRKRVAVPLSDFALKEITACEIKSPDELSENIFGIPEPKPESVRPVGPGELDLVIAPGIAFDECGSRIGYGKGFYDRFLSRLNPLIPVIGLAFDFQVERSIECEPHDCAMHKIITEKRVIDCTANSAAEMQVQKARSAKTGAKN